MNEQILRKAIKKAQQSICRYKVSAIGLNHRGEIICTAMNKPRFVRKGGGLHAEMNVMRLAGPSLKSIVLCRVGARGDLRSIDPCNMCREKAEEIGVKIYTIRDLW